MNRKLVIWAIVIIVLALTLFFAFNNSSTSDAGSQLDNDASSINPASAPTLESDDDVFNEFDNALAGVE